MAKNLIPIIAKELGVECEEIFKIKDKQDDKIVFLGKFTSAGLDICKYPLEVGFWKVGDGVLLQLLTGDSRYEVIKQTSELVFGERYWTYSYEWNPCRITWWGRGAAEYALLKQGILFRTKEEAIAARPAKYKELTGKEWENG